MVLIPILGIPGFLPAQEVNRTVYDEERQEVLLVGKMDYQGLTGDIFGPFYESEYGSYTPDPETIASLITSGISDHGFLVVLGTWCSDSQREVPRIIKVLNDCGIDTEQIGLIAVDHDKMAAGTKVDYYNIEKVPTLIMFARDEEVGRIIETPDETIESDLLNIILN